MLNLKSQAFPLPEDVNSAVLSGNFEFAELLIDKYLNSPLTPKTLKDRLLLEKHNSEIIKASFPYTVEEAEKLLLEHYPDTYKKGSIHRYITDGRINWRFINGELRIEGRLIGNAAKRCAGLVPPALTDDNADQDLLMRDKNVAFMDEHGTRKARIHVRCSLKPKAGFGEKIKVNLPVVKDVASVSDICFTLASPGYQGVDDPSAKMRTARFEKVLEEGDVFFIEYKYTITAHKRVIEKTSQPIDCKKFQEYLKEEEPHLLFTPYLKALAKEITKGIDSPSEKARAIYNWVTTHVEYSFMREYASINNITEYAASNLKGDCGVLALLFIALARISGIPARWQSGWYTTPEGGFCHDWAEFYLPEYGWCFADCSFGGAAYRQGKIERWKHYFGSDDVYRTPCNTENCRVLNGKEHYASDPVDNQRGEAETETRGLKRSELEWKGEVLSFSYLEE